MMNLPPLPHTTTQLCDAEGGEPWGEGYNADQMLAFGESCARMAREQERERIAVLVRDWDENTETEPAMERLAAAIRKG